MPDKEVIINYENVMITTFCLLIRSSLNNKICIFFCVSMEVAKCTYFVFISLLLLKVTFLE